MAAQRMLGSSSEPRTAEAAMPMARLELLPAELKHMIMEELTVFDMSRLSRTSRMMETVCQIHMEGSRKRAWKSSGRSEADDLSKGIAEQTSALDEEMLEQWATPDARGSVSVRSSLRLANADEAGKLEIFVLSSTQLRKRSSPAGTHDEPLKPWHASCALHATVERAERLGPLIDRAYLLKVSEMELREVEKARADLHDAATDFHDYARLGVGIFRDCTILCYDWLSKPEWRVDMVDGVFKELRIVPGSDVVGEGWRPDESLCSEFIRVVKLACELLRLKQYAKKDIKLNGFSFASASADDIQNHLQVQWMRVLFNKAQKVRKAADTLGWCCRA